MSSTVSVAWDAAQTFKEMVGTGFTKAHLPVSSMAVSGVMAGLFLSFGVNAMVNILYACPAEAAGPCKFLAGLGFSSGLYFILCMGAELFTGNCLLFLAVLARRIYWHEMVKDWLVIWVANLVGSILAEMLLFACGNSGTSAERTATGDIYCDIADAKSGLPPAQIFFRGICANILVCIAVLIVSAAKSIEGKFFGCAIPISVFIVSGFEHSIANMCIFSMAALLGCGGPGAHGKYVLNVALATVGNTCGACVLCLAAWVTTVRHSHLQLKEVPHPAAPSGALGLPTSVVADGPTTAEP